MEPLTIEEIASLAQVSRSTVSRVLNNHPSVRPAVRERVLTIINERNYAPRAAARSLANSRTEVLALLIPRSASAVFADPFFAAMIQAISEACTAQSYMMMFSMLSSEVEQNFYYRMLRGRHFDGVLMLSSDIDDPLLPLLIKDGTPLVLIGRHPYFQNLAWVDVENREGARQAVAHLLSLGHRRIATITGGLQMAVTHDRRDGYQQALLEAGLPILPELIVEGNFSQEGGYVAMHQLLRLAEPPRAVFVAGDTMSIGALRALHETGRKVPDDLALISFDDLPAAAFANPPLTTIHQPIREIASTAVSLLVDLIENRERTTHQVSLPVQLVVRRSCGSLSL